MTLALLLTAVTGAWAQTPSVKLFTVPDEWAGDNTELTAADFPGFMDYSTLTNNEAKAIPNPDPSYSHAIILFYGFNETEAKYIVWNNGTQVANTPVPRKTLYEETTEYHCKIYYTKDPNFIDVKWDAATKSGTFTMPAFGVEIDPIYAPTAVFATDGNQVLTPTAIEGIFAGTTDAIVKAGTVAMMGETENPQGQVMYAVTSINQATAPALDAFSADVPTAGNIADEGADVLIWYYIQGANTPDGQEATAENTFNDSEICETPIKVTVLPNKYDIHFNAANDNTIEAGKATVKVGETAATVTEGKLQGVKMGSEVKLEAKPGYKFRKVEVKKNDGSTRLDESTVGMIVCTNGKAYPVNMKDNLPSGVTAVGIVAYKNGKNGLVMALTDEATNMNWDTATGNNGAKAHTPAVEGYSWKLPTLGEWQYNIFTGAGVGNLAGLSTYMTAAGGTGLQNGCYWTSTPKNNSYYACCIKIENGSIIFSPGGNTELKSNGYRVRAVFAF